MKKNVLLLVSLLIAVSIDICMAQLKFPQKDINSLTRTAIKNLKFHPEFHSSFTSKNNYGISMLLKKYDVIKNLSFNIKTLSNKSKSDTLFVVADQTITGDWFHNGAIVIANSAVLTIKNANVMILGDVILWGNGASLIVDSSYLYFPQEYFYQRSIIAAVKSKIFITNSTLDYSNLSHNLLLVNESEMYMENVTNKGFTTCGLWGSPALTINGTNQAGEFIIKDFAKLSIDNATTVLPWHHFPDSASADITFPDGDSIQSYSFNKNISGVNGINYSVNITNSREVMWGLMPENGSQLTISNSRIRAIGLWFMQTDTVSVEGLVNKSNYIDFTAPVSDRKLRLINSFVNTWSLYPMLNSNVNVSSCILGEVGTGGSSQLMGTNCLIDGSGGYFWAGDTSITIAGWSSATTSIRSQNFGIFLFAYSALTAGNASAIGNSVLIVTQSSLMSDPVPLEKGCVWMSKINSPSQAFAGQSVNLIGSAWIDKTPESLLMDFSHYTLSYQKAGDTAWIQIGNEFTNEKRNDILGEWNTLGLEPGQYIIRLTMTDNSPDKNSVDAVSSVNLLPAILSNNNLINSDSFYISSDNGKNFALNFYLPYKSDINIKIFDVTGREQMNLGSYSLNPGKQSVPFSALKLKTGIYFVKLNTSYSSFTDKFVVF